MFVFLNAHILNRPEVFIGAAQTKFDAAGKLTDQRTRDYIAAMLVSDKARIAEAGVRPLGVIPARPDGIRDWASCRCRMPCGSTG